MNTNKRSLSVFCGSFLILALMVLFSAGVNAQVANAGTVLGTVTDPSGAVVAGAAVTLRNVGTGNTFSATTDQYGQYNFLVVPVGSYELIASKSGFKRQIRSAFAVHAAEYMRVDMALSVGAVSEEVTVSEAPAVVNTVTANEGNTVTGQQVNSLPLTNRVFTQLVLLEPGVSQAVDETPGFGSNSSVGFSVNGVRPDENNLLIDGVRNVDTFGGNAFVAPNLFAIAEFRIESNDYTATAGRSAGAQVDLISRAGTNNFHGDVFEFLRNDTLNAMNRFSTSNPENRYNDFGYDVGGPIKKDRLFFFWSQEWRRIIQSAGPSITVTPTALERSGNFSNWVGGPIIDPNTGLQFQGNIIPQNRLDKNALLLLQTYFPLPTPGFNFQGTYNFISEVPDYTRWREESIRVDAKLSNKLYLYGRYTQDSVLLDNPYGLWHENPFPNVGGSAQNFPMNNWSVHLTYTPKPNFISEFTTGMYFANDKALQNDPLSSKSRASGLSLQQAFPLDEGNRIPTLYFNGGYTGIVEQWFFHNDAYSIPFQFDNTWIKGRHTFRFGLVFTPEGKSELANPSSNNTNGTFTFSGDYTNNAMADFLLGDAYNYTETALDPFGKYRWYNLEPYIEDQIKLRPNLTLTAGLRYEYYQPEYEKNNMFGAFSPSLFNPSKAPTVNPDGTLVPGTGDPLNGIIVAGKNSPYGRALFPSHTNAFAPRIGLVWDPFSNGKTSVRAGYGIFYDRWGSYSQFGAFNPPFNSSVNIYGTSLDNPAGVAGTLYASGLSAALPPWKYPSVQKWSLSVQHEVLKDTTVSIAYVGSKGSHLLGYLDINQPKPNPLIADYTISPDYVRPYQGWSGITAYTNIFDSNYNALQASLIHRLKHGVSVQVSYTYAKALTDNSGPNSVNPSFPQDSYNIKAEYGPSDFDLRNVLALNYTWDIPFARSTKGVTKALLDGWQLSGITMFQSGAPGTIVFLNDNAGIGSWNERADQVGDPFKVGPVAGNPGCQAPSKLNTFANWFNPCAFAQPAVGTFGDSRRGSVYGPGFQNWDMGIMKDFRLREPVSLQFRLEAFNIFNHPNWGTPDYYIDDPNYSTVSSATAPRIVQAGLALKF
ncbi:MAG: TonB-dependent receptor [Terriglobales bacterium]